MKILYTAKQVSKRIEAMAQEIITNYKDEKPVFACLLKGGVPFTSQLMFAIARKDPTFHPEVIYLHTSTYGDGKTAGEVQINNTASPAEIEHRPIIVLDDCLDAGNTYMAVKAHLLELGAKSVGTIVLANKAVERPGVDAPLLSGFETPDTWLVGMGLDDAATSREAERWAGHLGDVA